MRLDFLRIVFRRDLGRGPAQEPIGVGAPFAAPPSRQQAGSRNRNKPCAAGYGGCKHRPVGWGPRLRGMGLVWRDTGFAVGEQDRCNQANRLKVRWEVGWNARWKPRCCCMASLVRPDRANRWKVRLKRRRKPRWHARPRARCRHTSGRVGPINEGSMEGPMEGSMECRSERFMEGPMEGPTEGPTGGRMECQKRSDGSSDVRFDGRFDVRFDERFD